MSEGPQVPQEAAIDSQISHSFPLVEAAGGMPPTPSQEELREKFPLQEIEFPNGKVVFRNMLPMNPNSEDAVVSLVGSMANQKDIGHTMAGVVAGGEHVYTLDFEGKGRRVKGEEGYSRELNRQAKLLGEFIDQLPQKKVILTGQSMSAITITSMLRHMSRLRSRIEGVIVASPMGMGGKDNVASLAWRNRAEGVRKGEQLTDEQKVKEREYEAQGKEFVAHNKERVAREVLGMADADIYDDFQQLEEWGIPAIIIQGDLDELNSSQRVWDNIAERSGGGNRWGQPSLIRPEETERQTIQERLADLADQAERAAVGDLSRKGEGPIMAKDLTPEEAAIAKEYIDKELALTQKAREEGIYPTAPIVMVGGGHEIYANDRMSKIFLREISTIRNSSKNEEEAHISAVRGELTSETPSRPGVDQD